MASFDLTFIFRGCLLVRPVLALLHMCANGTNPATLSYTSVHCGWDSSAKMDLKEGQKLEQKNTVLWCSNLKVPL